MAKFQGFKPKEKQTVAKPKTEKEFVLWGAAWLGDIKGYDLPYLSVKINQEDLAKINAYAESHEYVNLMMFPNRNQRDGMNDPDYYLYPPRDDDR